MISQELLNIPHVLPSIRFLQLKGTTSSLIHLVWLQHITITHFQNRFERLGNLMQTLQSPIKAKLEIGNIDFPSVEGKEQQNRFKCGQFATLLLFPDKALLPPPLKVKHEYLHDFYGVLGHDGDDDDDNNKEVNDFNKEDCFQGILIRVI